MFTRHDSSTGSDATDADVDGGRPARPGWKTVPKSALPEQTHDRADVRLIGGLILAYVVLGVLLGAHVLGV